MKKIKHFIIKRKLLSGIIILLILIISYSIYSRYSSSSGTTSYVYAKAEIKDIVTTITGTGQVSASDQVDIKSKVSGDIIYLNKEINGTNIAKGTLIAKIDTRDAEIALENAKIAYEKLVKPADQSTLLQNVSNLNDALANNKKSYEDGFNAVTDSLVDFPPIINGLNSMFYDTNGYLKSENIRNLGITALNYQSEAGITFDKAKVKYENFLTQYKNLSRNDATSTIESFVTDAYLVARNISEAVKSAQNAIEYARKQKSDTTGDSAASNITAWTSNINSTLTNLLNARTAIASSIQNITQRNVELNELVIGADELDIRSQLLNLRQKEYDYQNYFIRAPFDGVLARISVKSTDSVSSGTVIGTMVSSQKISNITLNEVDVAKVKVGQKVKLTFDAIDGLEIDGTVNTVDLVGTVSQGVVNYNVEITHDTQDERIKSGMSVSASIIVDKKQNVLTVPNSAIKTQLRSNYVEVATGASTTPPTQRRVQIGITNDTLTEIISGIKEGDRVVTRTITTGANKNTAPTIFSATGANRSNTGSGVRIPRN